MAYTCTEVAVSQLESHTCSQSQPTFSISVRTSNSPSPPASLPATDINTSPDILLLGGTYKITAVSPFYGRQDGFPSKIGDTYTIGANGKMIFNVPTKFDDDKIPSRKGEAIADFWNLKVQACQTAFNQHAENMVFALVGTLVLDVVDRKLGVMRVTFPNVGIGRGKLPSGTYIDGRSAWWFGGQTFEHMADDEKNVKTVRALGSDSTGRARYFYFSSVVGKTLTEELVDEIALTRIYGH
ncbi:hypothetical protein V8F20_012780 [Naviculisporaceae sp. PSN 640]